MAERKKQQPDLNVKWIYAYVLVRSTNDRHKLLGIRLLKGKQALSPPCSGRRVCTIDRFNDVVVVVRHWLYRSISLLFVWGQRGGMTASDSSVLHAHTLSTHKTKSWWIRSSTWRTACTPSRSPTTPWVRLSMLLMTTLLWTRPNAWLLARCSRACMPSPPTNRPVVRGQGGGGPAAAQEPRPPLRQRAAPLRQGRAGCVVRLFCRDVYCAPPRSRDKFSVTSHARSHTRTRSRSQAGPRRGGGRGAWAGRCHGRHPSWGVFGGRRAAGRPMKDRRKEKDGRSAQNGGK